MEEKRRAGVDLEVGSLRFNFSACASFSIEEKEEAPGQQQKDTSEMPRDSWGARAIEP